jgi:hypothetical protein
VFEAILRCTGTALIPIFVQKAKIEQALLTQPDRYSAFSSPLDGLCSNQTPSGVKGGFISNHTEGLLV